MKKTRPDDKLATLSAEQAVKLWTLLQAQGVTYDDAVQFVRSEFGVETSRSALARWWEKRALEEAEAQMVSACSVADKLGNETAAQLPHLTNTLKAQLVRAALTVQLSGGDPDRVEKFMRIVGGIEKAARETAKLDLDRDKFETEFCDRLLDMLNDKRAQEIAANQQPRAEQIAALRKIAFADVDATQVELPK